MRLALIQELKEQIPEALIFGAKDLETAIELITKQQYDLVLIDPGLPGYDGASPADRLAVVKRLVDASPGAMHLVISGSFTPEEWPRFKAAGVVAYLAKSRVIAGSIGLAIKAVQTNGTCVLAPQDSLTQPDFHYARLTQREQEALDLVRHSNKKYAETALSQLAKKYGIDPKSAQKAYKRAKAKLRQIKAPKGYW